MYVQTITIINLLLNNMVFNLLRRLQFAVAIIIYLVLLLSDTPPIDGSGFSDKTLHVLGNFLLFASLWLALGDKFKMLSIFTATCLFSSLAELSQAFTLSRTTDHLDILANLCGATLSYILCYGARHLYIRYQNTH